MAELSKDTGDWWKDRHDRLLEWTKNEAAVAWLEGYLSALEFFDDLIDRDRELPRNCVYGRIYDLLVLLPSNSFWLQCSHILGPQILLGLRNCSLANKLEERAKGDDLIWSYSLRQVVDITMTVIELTRGKEIADLLELEVHDWALNHPQANMEPYSEYHKEHTQAHPDR